MPPVIQFDTAVLPAASTVDHWLPPLCVVSVAPVHDVQPPEHPFVRFIFRKTLVLGLLPTLPLTAKVNAVDWSVNLRQAVPLN